ncbi:MAG: hypothetical protein KJ559_00050 [Nanoarchaeota archaeon]|nr:hypothetical protein [Nanoarchaeota archaeon]
MVSEKVAVILMIVAIILAVCSVAITLNFDSNNGIIGSQEVKDNSGSGNIKLIIEKNTGVENEKG